MHKLTRVCGQVKGCVVQALQNMERVPEDNVLHSSWFFSVQTFIIKVSLFYVVQGCRVLSWHGRGWMR